MDDWLHGLEDQPCCWLWADFYEIPDKQVTNEEHRPEKWEDILGLHQEKKNL